MARYQNLPIRTLSWMILDSEIFANVCLKTFSYLIKRDCGINLYTRYGDEFVLVR
jgi:hypothetical protein